MFLKSINIQPFENSPFRGQKIREQKIRRWKIKNTVNVILQHQFSIDYLELWHTTSSWSTETNYSIKFLYCP